MGNTLGQWKWASEKEDEGEIKGKDLDCKSKS